MKKRESGTMNKSWKDIYDELCEEDWEYRKQQVENGELSMEDAKFFHWMVVDDILWSMSET